MASSVSGPPAKRSPSSPTSGSTRCSTAARSRPASRSATVADPGLQGHGPGLPGLRRVLARHPARPHRGRALPLLDHRWSTWENAQPTFRATAGGTVALGHNGNLTNTVSLRDLVRERYGERALRELGTNTTDTALVTALLAGNPDRQPGGHRDRGAAELQGAFCLVFMDEHTLYAARDPQGIRPLVLGRLERGWVVASETAALDIVGASFIREVEPGELIAIDDDGLRSTRFAEAEPKGCVFEYVYLARPDTTIAGRGRARGPGRDGPPAGPRAPGRRRPGHPDARVRHAGRDRLRRRSPASRTARAWSRTPTSAGPSSSPPRPSASSASGSSSTRCAR